MACRELRISFLAHFLEAPWRPFKFEREIFTYPLLGGMTYLLP